MGEGPAPEVRHVWELYLRASEEARRRGDRRTGTDHLLLAVLGDPGIEATLGVTLGRTREVHESLDHDALTTLGWESHTEVPALPARAVASTPSWRDVARRDRFRLTPAAKGVLENAVRPNRRKTQVATTQVLAQLLALSPPDPAAVLLDALGVHASAVRGRVVDVTAPGGVARENRTRTARRSAKPRT